MKNISETETTIRLIASEQNWIEGEAIRQLHKTGELPGMRVIVGLPDLHPGRGNPVGAAFASQERLYPYLIGNDVGCGIGLWKTDLKCKKMKRDRWIKRLSGLEEPWDGDTESWLLQHGVTPTGYDSAGLGTIGGGNHFAELQIPDKIEDQQAFEQLGLDKDSLVLLIHSGSRGIGESLLRSHVSVYGAKGLDENTEDAVKYIAGHDHAVRWAAANRALIAERFLSCIGADGVYILDAAHNMLTQINIGKDTCWLHRKGAVPSDKGSCSHSRNQGVIELSCYADRRSGIESVFTGAWCRTQMEQKRHRKAFKGALYC